MPIVEMSMATEEMNQMFVFVASQLLFGFWSVSFSTFTR